MSFETVTLKNLSEFVSYLIVEFYKGHSEPFLSALADDVLWIGPGDGQRLSSAAAVRSVFSAEAERPVFDIGAIFTELVQHGNQQCDTVTFFSRSAEYPDGTSVTDKIVFHLSWVRVDDRWLMSVVSVAYRFEPGVANNLYMTRPKLTKQAEPVDTTDRSLHLRVKGSNNTVLIRPDRIEWAETDGHYAVIHFDNAVLTVSVQLRELEEMANGALVRCHQSFLVNPLYVRTVDRFQVSLSDGSILPIPERMYMSVRSRILSSIS